MPLPDLGMQVLNNSWSLEAPAHAGVTTAELIALAAAGGSRIIRLPADLSVVTARGMPQDRIEQYGEILAVASAAGLKVIFEPGQTPPDLSANGAPQGQPSDLTGIEALADRFAALVETVHKKFPQHAGAIAGWEVGNEPNLAYRYTGETIDADLGHHRYYAVSLDNADFYARYLDAVDRRIDALNAANGLDIKIIGAGIAHNDAAYMERMFKTLKSLDASVDGFAVHPYTTYDSDYVSPQSGRPTDWVEAPADPARSWNYYFSFQGALATMRQQLKSHGFGNAKIWVTEFGVPSYLGYRNAGPAGQSDQARWIAEALGVFDCWNDGKLAGITVHHVLDNFTSEANRTFSAYDDDTGNDGHASAAEGSFALYERRGGAIVAKPALEVFKAVAGGQDYFSAEHRIFNLAAARRLNLSDKPVSDAGFSNGYVVLAHSGADLVVGSSFDDSLFAGDGDDQVNGGPGNDRIFGGAGGDTLSGGDGDDDIHGNDGDDLMIPGAGNNRVDGGRGIDTLQLAGNATGYAIDGDARHLSARNLATGDSVEAVNVERIVFEGGSPDLLMENSDPGRDSPLGR